MPGILAETGGCALQRARNAAIRAFQPCPNQKNTVRCRQLQGAAGVKPRHFLSFDAPNLFQSVIFLPQTERIEKDFSIG
jgi:hypothetical protein